MSARCCGLTTRTRRHSALQHVRRGFPDRTRVFSGDLLCGFVGEERHYWNRLPNGQEVDVASDQFGGDGYTPLIAGAPVDVPSPTQLTALLFAQHVLANLNA
jgi:hypothetical protein